MAPLKTLVVFLLLFFCELQIASGLNFLPDRTSKKKPVDEWPTDEEHRIKKLQGYRDVRAISASIWDSRIPVNVQYDDNPRSNGRLFKEGYVVDKNVLTDLFQYYNKYTGEQDPCQGLQHINCKRAQDAFIKAIFSEGNSKGPIYVLHQWLVKTKLFMGNYKAFEKNLTKIWFDPYSRSKGILDSSGFEHVFLGEITQNGLSGLHNWMRLWWEETIGRTNGYFELVPDTYYEEPANVAASVEFKLHDIRLSSSKRSGFFMRTSPATEIALYTLCFMAQPDIVCQIELNSTPLYLRTNTMKNTKGLIDSAFLVFKEKRQQV